MSSILNDIEYINRIDQAGILQAITDFPKSALRVIYEIQQMRLKSIRGIYNSILIAGMGGSAIGGLLLMDWLSDTLNIPIIVNRGYHIPAWVNENTLVYAISYSGTTEETLNQYYEAIERGCTVICFSSGGRIEEEAKKSDLNFIKFPKGLQPRAAIPYQFYSLSGVTWRMGLIGETKWNEVTGSIRVIEEHCREMKPEIPFASNPGKKLAEEIKGFVPFIYAPKLFTNVAYRYSTQFNENSKTPAATNFYPEAFHNSIMAREGKEELLNKICVVIINDPLEDTQLNKKIGFSVMLMKETYGKVVVIDSRGETKLDRMMSALIQGDYTSAYLGILYGIDPSTTDSINILKANLKI